MNYTDGILIDLERKRAKAFLKFVLLLTIPIIAEAILVGLALFYQKTVLLFIVSTSSVLILGSVYIAMNLRKNFLKEAFDTVMPPICSEHFPGGQFIGTIFGADTTLINQSGFITASKKATYIENSIIEWENIRIWDAEVIEGSGKRSVHTFDSLVVFVKKDLPILGSRTLFGKESKTSLSTFKLFSINYLAMFTGFFIGTYASYKEVTIEILTVSALLALVMSSIVTYQLIRDKRQKFLASSKFEDKTNITSKVQDLIHEFEMSSPKNISRSTITAQGIFFCFPNIDNFLEIPFSKKLTGTNEKDKWNKQILNIKELILKAKTIG